MSKILLIEDEQSLARMIKSYLKSRLLTVECVHDGAEGLELLGTETYDAAIVDWNLPEMEGIEVVRRYRDGGGVTPIIMLTARDQLKEKVAGFECGADDYLTKPFQADELYARLKSIMRRPREIKSSEIRVGELIISVHDKKAAVGEKAIELTKKEFAILELLARNTGKIVSGESLVGRIWPSDSAVSTETLRSHITRLRLKLIDAAQPKKWDIKNVYGSGYVLEQPRD